MKNPFKSYDVRGVFNSELLPEDVLRIGACHADLIKQKISVARDFRTSSENLNKSFIAGFTSAGCDVVDIGVLPTPVSNYYGLKHKLENVTITGSHTSPENNGLKFYDKRGVVYNEQLRRIEEKYLVNDFKRVGWEDVGEVFVDNNAADEYILDLKSRIKLGRRLKIVFDHGNGVSAVVAPELFQELGCEVVNISAELDGRFPNRKPEPARDNIIFLQKRVVETKADFGCAFDGDADRVVFVDDKGRFVDCCLMACFFSREVLKEHEYAYIVASVDMSSALKKITEDYKGSIVWCPVGLTSISEGLMENKGMFAGEVSGHYHFNDFYPFSDGFLACAKLAKTLSNNSKKFSELLDELPQYPIKHAKFSAKNHEHKFNAFNQVKQELSKKYNINTIDGVKFFLNDTDWVLVRPSNTEPVIRLTVEALNEKTVNERFEEFSKLVKKFL